MTAIPLGREVSELEAAAHQCSLGSIEASKGGVVIETWRDTATSAESLARFDAWLDRMKAAGALEMVAVCACGQVRMTYDAPPMA